MRSRPRHLDLYRSTRIWLGPTAVIVTGIPAPNSPPLHTRQRLPAQFEAYVPAVALICIAQLTPKW